VYYYTPTTMDVYFEENTDGLYKIKLPFGVFIQLELLF